MPTDVVIVEDDELTAFAISVILSDHGLRVREAYTGEDGIELARAEKPAVVLLDVRLPGIDGWEVCRRIKQWKEGAPAVVFVTGATEPADRLTAQQVGGDGFIGKPFDVNVLVETVKNLLHHRERMS